MLGRRTGNYTIEEISSETNIPLEKLESWFHYLEKQKIHREIVASPENKAVPLKFDYGEKVYFDHDLVLAKNIESYIEGGRSLDGFCERFRKKRIFRNNNMKNDKIAEVNTFLVYVVNNARNQIIRDALACCNRWINEEFYRNIYPRIFSKLEVEPLKKNYKIHFKIMKFNRNEWGKTHEEYTNELLQFLKLPDKRVEEIKQNKALTISYLFGFMAAVNDIMNKRNPTKRGRFTLNLSSDDADLHLSYSVEHKMIYACKNQYSFKYYENKTELNTIEDVMISYFANNYFTSHKEKIYQKIIDNFSLNTPSYQALSDYVYYETDLLKVYDLTDFSGVQKEEEKIKAAIYNISSEFIKREALENFIQDKARTKWFHKAWLLRVSIKLSRDILIPVGLYTFEVKNDKFMLVHRIAAKDEIDLNGKIEEFKKEYMN